MSEKKIKSLMKKGEKLYRKKKVLEALETFNNILKISPDFFDALNLKTQILSRLGRPEEFFRASSKLNLLKLKKEGITPSDINSPDIWIEEAIKLINDGQNELSFMCIIQASYVSPIVNREGLTSMTHHTNAKIYYYTAIILFNKREKYDLAMTLFEIASKFDPNLTIPEKIKDIYNNYLSNRSGVGVKMIVPLNKSNLRALFPFKDKLLVSTDVWATAEDYTSKDYRGKIKTYHWETHMLLSDYGLAFIVAKPVCNQPVIYMPWPFITYDKRMGTFEVRGAAKHPAIFIKLMPKIDPPNKDRQKQLDQYINELNIDTLIEERTEEMIERTMNKLKSLGSKPSYKEYKKRFENIPKYVWQGSNSRINRNKRRAKKNLPPI